RSGLLERLVLKLKVPGMVNRFFVSITPHPVIGLFIDLIPAIAGVLFAKYASVGDTLGTVIAAAGVGVTVMSRLGMWINSKIIKAMRYQNGIVIESKGFVDEQLKIILNQPCLNLRLAGKGPIQ